jgi:predicted SnoaL-like aldol condensation-catalyzing enzyme
MMSDRKNAATDFLRLAASGEVDSAFARFAATSFRHHNVHFAGDAASLARAMKENAAQNPEKILEVQQVIAEGDRVVVFSRVRMNVGAPSVALVHIFRFEDGKIAELWDVAQPVPEQSPNQNGMF